MSVQLRMPFLAGLVAAVAIGTPAAALDVIIDGGKLSYPYGYRYYSAEEKNWLPLKTSVLAQQYLDVSRELKINLIDMDDEDRARLTEALSLIPEFAPIFYHLELGGMQGIQADEILSFIIGGAECIANDGTVVPERPYLIRSEMDLHYNLATQGAQIDVASLKLKFCIGKDFSITPIIVDRRWVVNIQNGNLQHQTNVPDPKNPGGPPLALKLSAQGTPISLVSYYVDGILQPPSTWNYNTNANSCIDIVFRDMPPEDGPLLISKPGDLTFCAGGACIGEAPGLDATN